MVVLLFLFTAFVRGNTAQNDTTGKALYIIFDLANAVQTGSYVDVPVMVSSKSDSVVSLDFEIKFNGAKMSYVSVSNVIGSKIGMTPNSLPDTILLTSFANVLNYYYPEDKPLFKIRFNILSTSINESDIKVNLAKVGLEERALNEWIDYNAFYKVTQRIVNTPVLKEKSKISVYPNPSSDYVYVETDYDATLLLQDITGKAIVRRKIAANKKEQIVDAKLPGGIYLLTVTGKSFSESQKVIIK